MNDRFVPQDGPSELAEHGHRYVLRGEPGSLTFPPQCPHCGHVAARRLPCAKVFRRSDSDGPNEHVVVSLQVPYCDACIARHRAESRELGIWAKVLSSFSTAEMLGAVFPGIAAVFVLWLVLKHLLSGDLVVAGVFSLLALFFASIALLQRRQVWRATEHLRVPRQSDITRAFDFSDNVAPAFEPPRFVCSVRDPAFAQAFEQLNLDREWVPNSPAAKADRRKARLKTWAIGAVVGALALIGLLQEWVGE
jgi:hypothetical protein